MSSNLADLPLDLLEDLHLWYWNVVVKMSSNLADLPLDLLTFQSLPVLTSCGQEELKFSRSIPRSAGRSIPWYWHLVVKVSSNLADLPLDLLTELHPYNGHLVVKMSSNLADLPPLVVTSHSQDEFKFGRSTPRSAGRSTPWYWHLVVKMVSNLADVILDLLADLTPWYWHLKIKVISNLADLSLNLLEDLHPQYWHLVAKMSSYLQIYP